MTLSPAPKRILIVKLSSLGDVVHTTPVIHDIRRVYPDADLSHVPGAVAAC